MLLLGAGESGKSTIVKQMKLLHPVNQRKEVGFSPEERSDARKAIFDNIMDSAVALLEAMESFGYQLNSSRLEEDKFKVLRFAIDHPQVGHKPSADVVRAIQNLWNNSTVQVYIQYLTPAYIRTFQ